MAAEHELSWQDWTTANIVRGCSSAELRDILMRNGFSSAEAVLMTGSPAADEGRAGGAPRECASGREATARRDAPADALALEAPDARTNATTNAVADAQGLFLPTALRIDTPRAEVYGVDGFLSEAECVRLIALVRRKLRRSTTTEDGVSDFRTSRTCELAHLDDPFVDEIDARICRFMGIDAADSEPIEGQWYEEGEEFKAHTDYFEPGSPGYDHHVGDRGQRSWTFMIYLNTTCRGGATHFPELGLQFLPQAGTALLWNNRSASGEPNPATLHHGMPIEQGYKAVITKWFRSRGPAVDYRKEANEYLPPLTRGGFLKTSMPAELHEELLAFYRERRDARVAESLPDYIRNVSDEVPSTLIELDEPFRHRIHAALQPQVEAWIGDHLEPTYVYGIREYRRGSTLEVHRDRIETHVASVILNVDQQVSSDWPLHIEDHHYRAHRVTLAPGEMVLYEGARLAHGRPDPFDGERFANVFVHFRRKTRTDG